MSHLSGDVSQKIFGGGGVGREGGGGKIEEKPIISLGCDQMQSKLCLQMKASPSFLSHGPTSPLRSPHERGKSQHTAAGQGQAESVSVIHRKY